jgi:hypothetical protein
MDKFSTAEVGQVMKISAGTIRALSEENQVLKTKVASFEKRAMAEDLATKMEEKGLQPELSKMQKVAGLMERDDLEVVKEAVSLSAPQMKLASVAEDSTVTVEGIGGSTDEESGRAESNFFTNLASE